jgi:hypothetical protein
MIRTSRLRAIIAHELADPDPGFRHPALRRTGALAIVAALAIPSYASIAARRAHPYRMRWSFGRFQQCGRKSRNARKIHGGSQARLACDHCAGCLYRARGNRTVICPLRTPVLEYTTALPGVAALLGAKTGLAGGPDHSGRTPAAAPRVAVADAAPAASRCTIDAARRERYVPARSRAQDQGIAALSNTVVEILG